MSKVIIALALAVASFATAAPAQEKGQQIDSKDPRSRPMVYALLATVDSDLELFKFAFSKQVRERIKDEEWPKGLEVYRRQLRGQLGDYKLGDIAAARFQFSGDDKSGRIGVMNKEGKVEGTLRLVKEEGAWKLNER